MIWSFGWPYHTYSKPLRLLVPFSRVKMAHGRIGFHSKGTLQFT
jgi:hypothetical protein